MEHLVSLLSWQNQYVLDPFMGSGSTGVACKNLARNFIGFELQQEYFDIAMKRLK
jgi:site-specific DNA-methyltransferase (adenine-specific)